MEDQIKNEKGVIVKQSKTWIEADKLRVDVDTAKDHHTMIYLVNEPKILIINRGGGTYFVMGPKEIATTKQMFQMQKQRMEQMQSMGGAMMKQQCDAVKAQQKSLPKEKQSAMDAQVSALCGGKTPGAVMPVVKWVKNGATTVAKWKCAKWTGKLGKQKVTESCNVTTKSVGIKESDFAVFKLVEKNFSMMKSDDKNSFVHGLKVRGIPVKTVIYEDGIAVETTIVTEIRKESFPATIFQAPKGSRQQQNPMQKGAPQKK